MNPLRLHVGRTPVVVPGFGISLYSNVPFSKQREAFLEIYRKYLSLCPPGALKWYATAAMNRHKPITDRTTKLPDSWFRKGASQKKYHVLELKGGETYDSASDFRCTICAHEEDDGSAGGHANLISMVLPVVWGTHRSDEAFDLVRQFCRAMPWQSGLAGFSLEWSRYAARQSHPHVWAASMRQPGLDIQWPSLEGSIVGHDAIRGINWITIVGDNFVKKIGGAASLAKRISKPIELAPVLGGVIVKAGPRPELGDAEKGGPLAPYQKIYELLSPLMAPISRHPSFQLKSDRYPKTEAWVRRFSRR